MTRPATVEDLDRELADQAVGAQRALGAQQEQTEQARGQLAAAGARIQDLQSELAAVREELRRTRAEVQWLRRAGVDLNRIMESPIARAGRHAARLARSARRSAPR